MGTSGGPEKPLTRVDGLAARLLVALNTFSNVGPLVNRDRLPWIQSDEAAAAAQMPIDKWISTLLFVLF